MHIRELEPHQLPDIYPFIALLNEGMTEARFLELLALMTARQYRCLAAFDGERMAGICGFWLGAQFFSGKQIEIDNLIVLPEYRGEKLGSRLTQAVESLARNEGCELAFLKAYTHNHSSHRFYFREGYHILGYGFVKALK